MVLLRHYSLLSLSIDCYFSPRGRCWFAVLGLLLFFLIDKEESRSAAADRNSLLHTVFSVALQSRSYTLFKVYEGMCFITWCVSSPMQGVQPITVCRRQHEVGGEHTGLILIATWGGPCLWSHSGLQFSCNSCNDPQLLWHFLTLLNKHKVDVSSVKSFLLKVWTYSCCSCDIISPIDFLWSSFKVVKWLLTFSHSVCSLSTCYTMALTLCLTKLIVLDCFSFYN